MKLTKYENKRINTGYIEKFLPFVTKFQDYIEVTDTKKIADTFINYRDIDVILSLLKILKKLIIEKGCENYLLNKLLNKGNRYLLNKVISLDFNLFYKALEYNFRKVHKYIIENLNFLYFNLKSDKIKYLSKSHYINSMTDKKRYHISFSRKVYRTF